MTVKVYWYIEGNLLVIMLINCTIKQHVNQNGLIRRNLSWILMKLKKKSKINLITKVIKFLIMIELKLLDLFYF